MTSVTTISRHMSIPEIASIVLQPFSSNPHEGMTPAMDASEDGKHVRKVTRLIHDILPYIFKYLEDQPQTLYQCTQVSRMWTRSALMSLYNTPVVRSVWALRRLSTTLVIRPHFRQWIRNLDLSAIRTVIPSHELSRLFRLLPRVQRLDVSYCRELRDSHLVLLTRQSGKHLQDMTLAGNRFVTDETIRVVAAHVSSGLVRLCIDECRSITDAALDIVARGCPNLAALKLAFTGYTITDHGLLSLINPVLPTPLALRTLQLYDCPGISDASLMCLAAACPTITALELFRLDNVSDVSLFAFARYGHLDSLCVGEMPLITDPSIIEIGRLCELRSLTICHCEHITDNGVVEILGHSHNIVFLDLGFVGDISLVSLNAASVFCPLLKDLVVSGNLNAEEIPTAAVISVVSTFSKLESLTVFQSRDITLSDIETIATQCPTIRTTFARQCVNISPQMAEGFSKKHKMQLVVK